MDALSTAPLVIVPLACKDVYLDRYARPDKGWTDRDEARWPVPYWYIDTGFTALLILLAVVDEGLGAVFFGIPPENVADFRAHSACPEQWTPIGAIAIGHPDPAVRSRRARPVPRPQEPRRARAPRPLVAPRTPGVPRDHEDFGIEIRTLRTCPETQVGCSWCDWLYLARRRVMMMVIAQ